MGAGFAREDWEQEMQLSSKGRYAVMAMVDLASRPVGGAGPCPVPLASISLKQNISQTFLEQIFMSLRRSGLVESCRGPGGGYLLARPAGEISIFEIMQAVEEPVQMTRCSLEEIGGCVSGDRCLTHNLWHGLEAHIEDYLRSTSLADVVPAKTGPALAALAGQEVAP